MLFFKSYLVTCITVSEQNCFCDPFSPAIFIVIFNSQEVCNCHSNFSVLLLLLLLLFITHKNAAQKNNSTVHGAIGVYGLQQCLVNKLVNK